MPSDTPRLLVVIVNYRSAELTVACLRSLEAEMAKFPESRVVVVENHSGEDQITTLEEAVETHGWSSWVDLIVAPGNDGFAAGNNLALARHFFEREERPDLVHLLNPDTEIRPGALEILVDFLHDHPEVGLAGSRSEDSDATPQSCCFRFPGIADEFASLLRLGLVDRLLARRICRLPIPEESRPVDWVSGASLMIRREVLEELGPLDDRYFMYYEETDFTLRARRKGWTCWHVPASRVIHHVGASSGVTVRETRPRRRPNYWFESRRRYFLKNHGLVVTALADLAALSGLALCRLRWWILRRSPDQDPPHLFLDLLRHSVFLGHWKVLPPREPPATSRVSPDRNPVPEKPLS